MATKAPKGQTLTAAAGKAAAKRLEGTAKKKAVQKGHPKRWLFGPYWLSLALTGLSWVAHQAGARTQGAPPVLSAISAGSRGPAILALLLLASAVVVAACQHRGQPLAGIDRPEEVVYYSACLAAAAGWTVAVGMGPSWQVAAATCSAATCACLYWLVSDRLRLPRWAAGTVAGIALAFVLYVLDPVRPRGELSRMASFGYWASAWFATTTAASVPRWLHRGIRRGVTVDKAIGAWRDAADDAGHEGITVVAGTKEALPNGWRVVVNLPNGQTWHDLANTIKKQESLARLRTGSITVTPDPGERAYRAVVQCVEVDAHKETQTWPGPLNMSITQPVAIGPRADGGMATTTWWTKEGSKIALVAGMRGSGKSTLLNTIMGGLAASLDYLPMGIDMKGRGVEFGPWERSMGALAVDLPQARGMLVALLAITNARGELLAERNRKRYRKTWQPGPWWADGAEVEGEPIQDGPLVLLFIDEAHECLGEDTLCGDLALRIAQLSRFAAVSMAVCTQIPQMASLGNAQIRGSFDLRYVLGFNRPQDAGFATEGLEKLNLEPWGPTWRKRRGTLYVVGADDDQDSLTARCYAMSEDQVDYVAEQRAGFGVRLDPATAERALPAIHAVVRDLHLRDNEAAEIIEAATAIIRQAASGQPAKPANEPEPASPPTPPTATPPRPARYTPARQPAMAMAGGPPTAPATPEVPMTDSEFPSQEDLDRLLADEHVEQLLNTPLPPGFRLPEPAMPKPGATPVGDIPKMTTFNAITKMLAMADTPNGASPKEMMAETGFKASWTDDQLRAMVDAGKLVKVERGRYVTPAHAPQTASAPTDTPPAGG